MKKAGILLLALTLVFSISAVVFAEDETNVVQIIGDNNTVVFIDVPEDYWAKDEIESFAKKGIVTGYEDGTFAPDAGVTREEFCKLLVSTFNAPLQTPPSPSFSDVGEGRWSYPYIEVCSEFLTGYANPFGGLPAFHPEDFATREDIAVALVRMLGYTDADASNPDYVKYKFSDGGQVSPGLMGYVSLACEKGLLSGYPDGTFGPQQGITRAETVVLLNRASKQAMTDIKADLELTATVIYSSDGKVATINIQTELGASVTVDGASVKMSNNGNDQYEGNYVYYFTEEGTRLFTVTAEKAGKTKTVTAMVKYEINAPVLTITNCPQISDKDSVTISGTVQDERDHNSGVTVMVNGSSVSIGGNGEWSKEVRLTEGENTIIVTATNSFGKTTTETRTVIYMPASGGDESE